MNNGDGACLLTLPSVSCVAGKNVAKSDDADAGVTMNTMAG